MDRSELFEKIYKEKSFVYNKFFNNFEKDFRLLKKLTHECQAKCYGNDTLNRKQSEDCAMNCLKPLKKFKGNSADLLDGCERSFADSEIQCLKLNNNSKEEETCLTKQVPQYQKCYDDNISNFDKILQA